MNRRSFLSMLGLTAAGAAVAPFIPKFPETTPAVAAQPVVGEFVAYQPAYNAGMRGVPYIINNTGDYFGFTPHRLSDFEPMVTAKEIAEREQWYNSLPKNRSLIPEDYRRG